MAAPMPVLVCDFTPSLRLLASDLPGDQVLGAQGILRTWNEFVGRAAERAGVLEYAGPVINRTGQALEYLLALSNKSFWQTSTDMDVVRALLESVRAILHNLGSDESLTAVVATTPGQGFVTWLKSTVEVLEWAVGTTSDISKRVELLQTLNAYLAFGECLRKFRAPGAHAPLYRRSPIIVRVNPLLLAASAHYRPSLAASRAAPGASKVATSGKGV